jgi:probable O-glycosylation ligase (exosortase A-associated)
MTVPLLYYLYRQSASRTVRQGLLAAMMLTSVAAIGTQSRGALLGMSAMGVMLFLKGKQKLMIPLIAGAAVFAIAHIMPEEWYARMATIRSYEGDGSVQGRFSAWETSFNIARDRFFGGGFEALLGQTDAHSIYFEVLGEHGFVGLAIFLSLGLLTWFSASRIRRQAQRHKETVWLSDLMRMVQVSIAAYAATGAFLGMAYFDYFYNLVLVVVVSRAILERELPAQPSRSAAQPALSGAGDPSGAASRAGAA